MTSKGAWSCRAPVRCFRQEAVSETFVFVGKSSMDEKSHVSLEKNEDRKLCAKKKRRHEKSDSDPGTPETRSCDHEKAEG